MRIEAGRFLVRLAESGRDVDAALRLRHRVFVEELGARSKNTTDGLEHDGFDEYCEHLLLIDRSAETDLEVVGAYRMLPGTVARSGPGFYSSSEFDLGPLEERAAECLEVGRTCVARQYRGGPATQLLWAGLAAYVFNHDVGVLFGCASYPGTDIGLLAQPLSYLHHFHLAPADLRARARPENRAEMNLLAKDELNRSKSLQKTPSLIKGYLRLGGFVGDGASIDTDFGVTDVLLVVDAARISEKKKRFYRDQLTESLARLTN